MLLRDYNFCGHVYSPKLFLWSADRWQAPWFRPLFYLHCLWLKNNSTVGRGTLVLVVSVRQGLLPAAVGSRRQWCGCLGRRRQQHGCVGRSRQRQERNYRGLGQWLCSLRSELCGNCGQPAWWLWPGGTGSAQSWQPEAGKWQQWQSLQSAIKARYFMFPWIWLIYSFLLFPASQCLVETRGTVTSWRRAGSASAWAWYGEGGFPVPAMLRAQVERTGGHVQGHAALCSSGNWFWVLLCILSSGPAVNWERQTKTCRKRRLPSCTLARPALRVSA